MTGLKSMEGVLAAALSAGLNSQRTAALRRRVAEVKAQKAALDAPHTDKRRAKQKAQRAARKKGRK